MSVNASKSISLFPVLLVNFIGTMGYSIIMPFLVFLVTKFGGNEFMYGILGAIYPTFQLFGAPLLGRWSDILGRKRILFLSQMGTFLAWVIFIIALFSPKNTLFSFESEATGSFIFTLPLLLLFVARALDGLTGGNISVANAYLSDISTDENRKANFGKMAMSASLGFIIGPAIAGLLGATSLEELLPVTAAAVISFLAMGTIQFYLPESKQNLVDPKNLTKGIRKLFQADQRECFKMKNCPETGLKSVLKIPYIPLMFVMYFITFLGFNFFYVAFPIFAMGELKWTSLQLGIFFTVMSGMMILVQGPLLSWLSKKVSDAPLVIVGSFILSCCFFLMSFGSSVWVWLGVICFSLGNGLMWPSFLSILSKFGGEEKQGTVQGYANSLGSAASIIGLILGGFLFGLLKSYTFLLASGFLFLIALLAFRLLTIERVETSNKTLSTK